MSAGTVIVIVVVLVLLAVALVAAIALARRRTAERANFGPEYDRLADEVGPRKANTEFAKRRQRVDGLIKPLSDERRSAYASQWEAAQEQFVDRPAEAVSTAGALVTAAASDRGYQAGDPDQFLADLSVYHGRHLAGYRHARQLASQAGQASTEEQRQAVLEYRGLFFDLLEPGGRNGTPAPDRTGPPREEAAVPADARPDETAEEPAPEPASGSRIDQPWKLVTQGRHWKSRRQHSDGTAASR